MSAQDAAGAAPVPGFAAVRQIAADHPAFAGHFPGQPVLPGVCLLAEVQAAWRAAGAALPPQPAALTLAAAKFLAPVRPGAALHIQLSARGGQLRFEVADAAGVPVASGQYLLAPLAGPAGAAA